MSKLECAIKEMADKTTWEEYRRGDFNKRVVEICSHYADKLNLDPLEVFEALERQRTYSYPNYYQEANFPNLDKVMIFENVEEMNKIISPSKGFKCPACGGVSKSHTVCDSGVEKDGNVCDWKSYGLFRTLGKGLSILIKDKWLQDAKVYEIFYPISLEVQPLNP